MPPLPTDNDTFESRFRFSAEEAQILRFHWSSGICKVIYFVKYLSCSCCAVLRVESAYETSPTRERGVDLVPIDLTLPVAEQGPFDIIVHKVTDLMELAKRGNVAAKAQLDNFLWFDLTSLRLRLIQGTPENRQLLFHYTSSLSQSFTNAHPEVTILDPLRNIDRLLNRAETLGVLEDCRSGKEADDPQAEEAGEPLFYVPANLSLPSSLVPLTDDMNVPPFPVICKRLAACSSELSHQMVLVSSLSHFSPGSPDRVEIDDPVILQQFVDHDGIIFKVYVLGDHVSIMTRPSLRNVEGAKPIYFDSQKIPKTFTDRAGSTSTTAAPETDQWLSAFLTTVDDAFLARKESELDRGRVEKIAKRIQKCLVGCGYVSYALYALTLQGLTFLGFDVIIESRTRRHYVVDVNYFSSTLRFFFLSIVLRVSNPPSPTPHRTSLSLQLIVVVSTYLTPGILIAGFTNVPDFRRIFVDLLKAHVKRG
ncbi:inositol 1, 3, 4-trisphosphate 5/6-kinase-domain-containing protein [Jimgerdemannia flammicorona]|uniref:Inositol 1, 3, 4-trisphosphate 5/6-kinase-domain-containing protein n=1 Tax=Jimgerdemannia flammicorona TaxID=994334 RepID=A0A433QYP4_9FUNG|nr:inositol 1, 3, 4-trisphosphate 5/6-kinase-domain-containing protein [Jimgerdemannia flammicorona]